MANDPTVDANGNHHEHDTFPPGAIEVYERTRALLIERLGDRLQLDTPEGRRRLNDIVSRIVAIAREAHT